MARPQVILRIEELEKQRLLALTREAEQHALLISHINDCFETNVQQSADIRQNRNDINDLAYLYDLSLLREAQLQQIIIDGLASNFEIDNIQTVEIHDIKHKMAIEKDKYVDGLRQVKATEAKLLNKMIELYGEEVIGSSYSGTTDENGVTTTPVVVVEEPTQVPADASFAVSIQRVNL